MSDRQAPSPGEVTRLLTAHRAGDAQALGRVFEIVYRELRGLAGRQLRAGSAPTLSATTLVHELFVKVGAKKAVVPQDRAHFLALSARAMRQITIDYARQHAAQERGASVQHVPLEAAEIAFDDHRDELLAIDRALRDLHDVNARLEQVVECRFFAGLTEQETAEALSTSVSTVQRDWTRAKAWLKVALEPS